MELLQLKYFKEVADCGKMVTAAERLFISPPAISAAISRLEKEVGCSLFHRSKNRIVLNEQGEILLRYVNQMFSSLDNAATEIRSSLEEKVAHLQIGFTTSNLWPELLTSFSADYPHVTISGTTLSVSHLELACIDMRYSFVFAGSEDMSISAMDSVCLFRDRLVVIVNEKNPISRKTSISPAELKGQTLYLPMAHTPLNRKLKELFGKCSISLRDVNECSASLCEAMASANCGITFSTERAVPIADPTIRYVPLDVEGNSWEQRIYWTKKRALTPEERCFLDFVCRFYGVREPAQIG